MIKVKESEGVFLVSFNGKAKDFDNYMYGLSKIKNKKYDTSRKRWIVKNKEDLIKVFDYDPDCKDLGWMLKFKLYDYQAEALDFCLKSPKTLLVLPCGSGKTAIGIGAYAEFLDRGLIKGPGVIVVKASLKLQWKKEVEKFSDLSANVIETKSALCVSENGKIKRRQTKLKKLDPLKDKKEYQALKKEITELEELVDEKFNEQFSYDLLIMNYEALCNDDIRKKLHKVKPEFIFSDEVHSVKSYRADRSKALYEFGDAKVTIGATATPVQKDYEDVFGIFKFVKADLWQSFSSFAGMHIKYGGPGRVIGFKNVDTLKKKIAPYVFIKSKEEVSSQLPSLVVVQRYCELDDAVEQKTQEIYIELEELRLQEKAIRAKCSTLKEVESNPELLKIEAQIMALQTFAQELADDPSLLEDSESDYAKNYLVKRSYNYKLEALSNLVEEILDSGEKVCIFSRFVGMQGKIADKLMKVDKKLKIAYVHGSMSDEERYNQVYDKFRDTDDYKVLICSDAGSTGLNLSKCKYIIEYDLAESYAIQTQRHGRVERSDSIHDNVVVYQLIANNSYDEIALKIVSKKERYDFELIQTLK